MLLLLGILVLAEEKALKKAWRFHAHSAQSRGMQGYAGMSNFHCKSLDARDTEAVTSSRLELPLQDKCAPGQSR